MTLTPEQVQAQATAIRKRPGSGSRVMALQHSGAWSGPDRMEVAGEEHKVIACVSDLQIREALGQLEGENRAGILLCNFDPAALGDDVLARLSKRRIHHPRMDEMMRELFSARLIDARVLACKPLVDALIREASAGPYPPPPGGILDLASAWRAFLKNLLKQEISEINFPELLRWTARKPPSDLTLSQLANDYYTEGGFVEWARNLVAESDPNPRVKESLRATVESIDAWWSIFQGCFAERLKQWAEQNSDLNGVLRIEEVLHDVVGPVAKQQPVLQIGRAHV